MNVATSAGARRQFEILARSHPESAPLLTLVAEVLRANEDPVWETAAAATTLRPDHPAPVPLLAGATVPLPGAIVGAWLRRLLVLAVSSGGPVASPLAAAAASDQLRPVELLQAAINQDGARLTEIAMLVEAEPGALDAVAQLATVPLLQACRRRLTGAVSPAWDEGFCPICGFWPALAETRGLERARRLRCGRCGGDWGSIALRCPYCRTADHDRLGALVPAEGREARRVETCSQCHGYLKTVTTLRAWAGDEVGLADLATVELDLAAIDHGYARPETPAVPLGLRLVEPATGADVTARAGRSR